MFVPWTELNWEKLPSSNPSITFVHASCGFVHVAK